MSERQSTDLVQLKVRIRECLRSELERAAAADGESMNAAIVRRLERTFRDDEVLTELRAIRATLDGGR